MVIVFVSRGLKRLCEVVLVSGKGGEGRGLGDSDDEKHLSIQEERRDEDISHHNEWTDEKHMDTAETASLDGYGCRQDVESHGMHHG